MKGLGLVTMTAALAALGGCGHMMPGGDSGGGWTVLFDGKSLAAFDRVGDANWRVVDGMAVADKGTGFLVTKASYGDFEIKAEFYAEADTNSGIFIRCQDPKKLTGNGVESCYEVNIWDDRPKQEHGTGAIVDVAAVVPMPKAGGKWNTYDITVKADHFVVVFNGVKTVDVHHSKFARGVIGLQHAPGVKGDTGPIKFRRVEIRPL